MSIVEKLGGVPGKQTIVETLGGISGYDVISDVAESGGGSPDPEHTLIKTFFDGTLTDDTAAELLKKAKSVGNSVFNGCTSLESVTIPESITELGYSAFQGCTNLKTVNMPGVKVIHAACFYGCTALATINIPNVEEIQAGSFGGNQALLNLDAPKLRSWPSGLVGNFKRINFPLVTEINGGGNGLSSVEQLIIPSAITMSNALNSCASLKALDLRRLKTMQGCCSGCNSLTTIIFEDIESIISSFDGDSNLVRVEIHNSTPPTISSSFGGANDLIIYVPADSVETYQNSEGWSGFNIQALEEE